MGTIAYKRNTTTWGDWYDGGSTTISPTKFVNGIVDNKSSQTGYTATGANTVLSSLAVQDTATNFSVTGSFSTVIQGAGGVDPGSGRYVYIGVNKTVSINTLVFSSVDGVNFPTISVDSGATLTAAVIGGANTVGIEKYGAGTLNNTSTDTTGNGRITSWTVYDGVLVVSGGSGTNPLGNGPLTLFNGSTLRLSSTKTYTNSSFSVNGTVTLNNQGTSSTITPTLSGSGTLVITSTNTTPLTLNGGIACSINITSPSVVTLASAQGVGGAVLAGNGTLNMASANNSVILAGTDVSGAVTIAGGKFVWNTTGTKTSPAILNTYFSTADADGIATLTLSGGGSGGIDTLFSSDTNKKTIIVTGQLTGTSPNASVKTLLGTAATLRISGASARVAAAIDLGYRAVLALSDNSTSQASNISTTIGPGAGEDQQYLTADASQTSYSGNITTNGSTGKFFVDVASSGTLSFTGAAQSITGNSASRRVEKTGSGTWRLTGAFTVNTMPVTVAAGVMYVNTIQLSTFAGGLTVSSGATLACQGNSRISAAGNITMSTGSTFKFGAP